LASLRKLLRKDQCLISISSLATKQLKSRELTFSTDELFGFSLFIPDQKITIINSTSKIGLLSTSRTITNHFMTQVIKIFTIEKHAKSFFPFRKHLKSKLNLVLVLLAVDAISDPNNYRGFSNTLKKHVHELMVVYFTLLGQSQQRYI